MKHFTSLNNAIYDTTLKKKQSKEIYYQLHGTALGKACKVSAVAYHHSMYFFHE